MIGRRIVLKGRSSRRWVIVDRDRWWESSVRGIETSCSYFERGLSGWEMLTFSVVIVIVIVKTRRVEVEQTDDRFCMPKIRYYASVHEHRTKGWKKIELVPCGCDRWGIGFCSRVRNWLVGEIIEAFQWSDESGIGTCPGRYRPFSRSSKFTTAQPMSQWPMGDECRKLSKGAESSLMYDLELRAKTIHFVDTRSQWW